ncbi:MAG: hypothetical protein ACLRFI_02545 [Alphaproteobacteria bacterium]
MGQLVSDVTSVLDYNKSKHQAKNKRQEILQEISQDEKNKVNLVKKALATQRAKYGASGMNANGTTEGVVLKRLKSETEQPYDDKKKTNFKKIKELKTSKPNLLKTLLSRFDDLLK